MSTMVSTVFNCLKGDLSFTLFAVANLWFYFCNQKCWTSLIQWHFDLNFVFLYLWLLYLDTNQFRCSLSLAFYLLPLFHFHWIVEQVKAILRPFTRKHCENSVRPFVLRPSVCLSVVSHLRHHSNPFKQHSPFCTTFHFSSRSMLSANNKLFFMTLFLWFSWSRNVARYFSFDI